MIRLTKREKERVDWIKKNLPTRKKWTKYDYEEFYKKDIDFLLKTIKRLSPEIKIIQQCMMCMPVGSEFVEADAVRGKCEFCGRTTRLYSVEI